MAKEVGTDRKRIIAPDETLPLGQTLVLGLQHAVAMFGATVLMPLLMGWIPIWRFWSRVLAPCCSSL
nr:solute carrier family 23 protein [Pantoea agglomerans]